MLTKQNQKDKMSQEIALHRSINHENVVKFYSFFEDDNFVYVVLELCKRRVSFFTLFIKRSFKLIPANLFLTALCGVYLVLKKFELKWFNISVTDGTS